ncbi:hypothetical protein F444_14760 [Phytophthora nicotianae P1976]|uniref:Histone-lysine N-methyltransferase, H3 lysine-79 specific n=1 Tax=Phytophthora nicotianae P1976 TaxID=1317066 RepID=A0A080ZP27_PHYNI|nr:hypothetical protein F444_14760 [Phytophthora nicotianae P1976]
MDFGTLTSEVTLPSMVEHEPRPVMTNNHQALTVPTLPPMDLRSKTMLGASELISTAAGKSDVASAQWTVEASMAQNDKVPRDVHRAVSTIFENISRREVVYPPGAVHLNAGEIIPSGVSALITSILQLGTIGTEDVFLDIGSGVGNVVTQFALSTAVHASIGVEIRRDLVDRCNGILGDHAALWPRLQNVEIYAADVKEIDLSITSPYTSAMIVLANNLRFDPSATNHIGDELSKMPAVWVAAFTSEVCPRHNSICTKPFCDRWKLHTSIQVNVSWTSKAVPLHIYAERRK